MVDRRSFLGLGAAAAGLTAAKVVAGPMETPPAVPRIKRYVRLGRTELAVSDISFGSSRSDSPQLVRHALARGVNYFDTAESYRSGDAERAMGEVLPRVRDRIFIASKHKARVGESKADMMRALEGSLTRLRTDHVDVYFNHAVNDVDRIKNEEWWSFTEAAKEQGKIRFRGMSGHGSRLVECLDYAVDHDLVDVVLCSFSFAQDPSFYSRMRHTFHFVAIQQDLPRVLQKAKAKDIGIVAMKTLMGARLNDMRAYERRGGTFAQAAFRWVLSTGLADALVISMTGPDLIDEYVAASGDPVVSGDDLHLLELYTHLQTGQYCFQGCRACDGKCPQGVDIAEVLRTRMYDVDYRDRLLARTDYGAIAHDATPCLSCSGQPCVGSCPAGIPIAAFTRDAATRLC